MTVGRLLSESERQFDKRPAQVQQVFSSNVFDAGARWMFQKLHEDEPETAGAFDASINFSYYGYLKYGLSLLAFLTAGFVLGQIHLWLMPLAVLVFYGFEVHFLFLFPLLLDRVENPIQTSIEQTYRIGFVKALLWVFTIAMYMLSGLLNHRNPWRKWHIGCLSIVLWYKYEVRNRVQS
ncbi:hypothetical protein [Hymenobacter chitinivorans]|uniref:Uncharacterized protein n=1 Tax=Hymenobacter chitinivorans DSM 11115 TaxID=1121954 RepID=A0A2M9BTB5_9BACT|nr:hypothetical protein [Hymenobacter chitinivorans]PJJ61171.1 hypothetical protein CLV45_2609 [Hymenobacter chitinivorans DSM 11115]